MRKTCLVIGAAALLTAAAAQAKYQDIADRSVELSASYAQLSSDVGGLTLDNDLLMVGVGYTLSNTNGRMSITPGIQVGRDINSADLSEFLFDDTIGGPEFEFEIDRIVVASVRITLHPTDQFYAYLRPSYSRAYGVIIGPETERDVEGDWEFGAGAGVGYNFTENFSADISLDRISNDTDFISLNTRYSF